MKRRRISSEIALVALMGLLVSVAQVNAESPSGLDHYAREGSW